MDLVKLEEKIETLKTLREKEKMDIDKFEQDIIHYATSFETYQELFSFVKRHTSTLEDFNRTMFFARTKWLDKKC